MAKEKQQKQRGPKGVPNRHLHARTTFLYQAATYLTLHASKQDSQKSNKTDNGGVVKTQSANALRLGSHLRSVSLKTQTRLSEDMKRSICKTCNAILISGRTSTHTMDNKSKGGKKPWADVLEVECHTCSTKKRFPVGATRQQRKTKRVSSKGKENHLLEKNLVAPGPATLSGSSG